VDDADRTSTRPGKPKDVQAEVRMIASSENIAGEGSVAVAGSDQPVDLSREADRISRMAIEPGGRSEAQLGPIAEAGTPATASDPQRQCEGSENGEVVSENAEIREAQMADAEIRAILKYKQKGRQPDHVATSIWPEEAKELLLHWNSLSVPSMSTTGVSFRVHAVDIAGSTSQEIH